jgi:ABC-type transporter Mla maintaining outer membrane lipid asymmetry permease subunit MlaE
MAIVSGGDCLRSIVSRWSRKSGEDSILSRPRRYRYWFVIRHRWTYEQSFNGDGVLMATVLEDVGKKTIEHLNYVGSLNIQLWSTLRAMKSALPLVGNRYRWQATVRQMLQIGYDALPMVSLMSVCTGFILALQGASELRRFGALHYVIDLVAVGFTRELGPLLTAIAVSGRSGSAFCG